VRDEIGGKLICREILGIPWDGVVVVEGCSTAVKLTPGIRRRTMSTPARTCLLARHLAKAVATTTCTSVQRGTLWEVRELALIPEV